MSYTTQKLKDISIIRTGKLDSNAAVENGIYPFFTCDPQTLKINTWAYDTEAVLLAGNNASGNYTAKYYRGKFNAYQRTYIIETADSEVLSVRFLCYAINQQLRLLKTMSSGSTTKFLTIRMLNNLDIPCPEIEVQERIVNMLGTIDDLIENNQKQIKLLEEAAQRLYKEWFVDLRFPGYENTPIVDGVPEGWRMDTIGGICTLKKETVSAGDAPKGTPYIGLEHMPRVDFCLSSWGDAEDVTSNKFKYTENDIIFGKIRPYFHKVGFALNSGVVSTDSFVMKAEEGLWGLLLMTVFDKSFVDYTYKTCKEGAKMPRADWKQMIKYEVLIPEDDSIRQSFEETIWSIARRIKILAIQNRSLAEARDRLLPKLMSGEIEV